MSESDTAVAVVQQSDDRALALEDVVIKGDLTSLTPTERLRYYAQVCKSLGINPLTKPFLYINFPQKGLQLYASRDATDQLRKINAISITDLVGTPDDDIYIVVAKGVDRTNRTDMATGAVPYGTLKGEARANAIMKAETKAKRRLTLSLAGLGWLDEVEVESIDDADAVNVDPDTGEILPGTWEGRVKVSDRPGADLELHFTGHEEADPDGEYARLAGEESIEFVGFKIDMANRKSAQVLLFAELTEQVFIEDGLAFQAGDSVRVTGKLEFVEWEKDGRKMAPFRRIIAASVEKV